jgi:uncharacterized Zn-binding protein involved in type VI secretion
MADDIEDPDDSSESGEETSSGEGGAEKKEGGKEKEEDEEAKNKSGYGKEWKPQKSIGAVAGEYDREHGWQKTEAEKPEKEPGRKITIYQRSWLDEKDSSGYAGGYGGTLVEKKESEPGFGSGKISGGLFYYKKEAVSELSADLNKKELNLTLLSGKGQFSLEHGEAEGKFKLGAWLASFFKTSEKPGQPAPAGVPGMGALMAARVGDLTSHGSPLLPGIGSPNVMIGNKPAWRTEIDTHACPVVKVLIPDGGGVVVMGSPTVFINFMMACRISDIVVEIPGGPNAIAAGCPTVFIGPAGAGGAAGGGGGSGTEGGKDGEKSEGDGLTVQGKAAVDVDTVSGELAAGAVVDLHSGKAQGQIKGSLMAAVLKGSIETGITIPLWGKHSITFGTSAEGSLASIGVEGHLEGRYTKEEGFHASAGLGAALGAGGALNFTIGFK